MRFGHRTRCLGSRRPDYTVAFLREIDAIHLRRRDRVVDLVVNALGGAVFEENITVLGAAFKPHSAMASSVSHYATDGYNLSTIVDEAEAPAVRDCAA